MYAACAIDAAEQKAILEFTEIPKGQRLQSWLAKRIALPAGILFVGGLHMRQLGWRWTPIAIHQERIEDCTPAVLRAIDGRQALEVLKPGFLLHPLRGFEYRKEYVLQASSSTERYVMHLQEPEPYALEILKKCDVMHLVVGLLHALGECHEVKGCLLPTKSEDLEMYSASVFMRDVAGLSGYTNKARKSLHNNLVAPLKKKICSAISLLQRRASFKCVSSSFSEILSTTIIITAILSKSRTGTTLRH